MLSELEGLIMCSSLAFYVGLTHWRLQTTWITKASKGIRRAAQIECRADKALFTTSCV